MRIRGLHIFLFCLCFCTNLSAQTLPAIEDSLLFYTGNIQKYSLYYGKYWEGKDDTLYQYNQALQEYLINVLRSQPLSLEAKFEKLSGSILIVATSEDKRFRIYSWDKQGGGTMHGYYSIVQYKTSKGASAEIIYPKPGTSQDMAEDKEGPGFYYPKIYNVHSKENATYYLAIRNGRYQTWDVSTEIKAFKIEGDALNDSVRIFKAAKDHVNSIGYEYNFFSNYNDKTAQENYVIRLSTDNQRLYVPIVNDLKVTSKYLVYVFDGNYFVFDKNAK
jgi:hypothetical protein